jgi:hypothetical protein
MLGNLGATMMQGFAFGTGSAVAREAVGAVMGGGSSSKQYDQAPAPVAPQEAYQAPVAQGPCATDFTAFNQCMQQNQGNIANCDYYYQALQACQINNQ